VTPATALSGRSVLLTRSEEDCAEWAGRLAARGACPVTLPCIHAETLDTPTLRAMLATATASADWIAFTSRRGVEAFAALGAAPPAHVKIAVVGTGTAAAAEQRLGRVDLIGRGGTSAALGATLIAEGSLMTRPLVLLALAENAGDALETALSEAGARCTRLDLYRTVPAPATPTKRAMSTLGADNVLLASPSAVTGFMRQVELDVPVRIYTIGPSTTAAARAQGLAVTAEAREPSLEGILEAMQWQKT
jgi:uroporphyrinogen-III synthase